MYTFVLFYVLGMFAGAGLTWLYMSPNTSRIKSFMLWFCPTRMFLAENPSTVPYPSSKYSYTREIGAEVSLYDSNDTALGSWLEADISDCAFGCKIYMNNKTKERVLAHSSAYGCFK